jgi:hypothetical protein
MIKNIAKSIKQNIINLPGWRTNRKIIVFESDDWGSIRMPSITAVEKLKEKGFAIEKCRYMQNDALESNGDLESLFGLLYSRKNKPVITANFLTANPDFERIEANKFKTYYNESLETTLAKYPNHDKVKSLWLEGMNAGVFQPQLHGREHLNISRWMTDLQNENKETRKAFQLKTFGVSGHVVKEKRGSYQAAFDQGSSQYKVETSQIIKDAVEEFERLFNFKPKTFIAPNYIWGQEVEKITSELGITHIQGTNTQRFPRIAGERLKVKRNFLGHKNKYDQKYLIRNCKFEPFGNPDKDWVNHAMRDISRAFMWKKPAIISTHRVNFIGSINPENKSRNLKLFKSLLDEIEKKWPNVEYMSSDQLAKLI